MTLYLEIMNALATKTFGWRSVIFKVVRTAMTFSLVF